MANFFRSFFHLGTLIGAMMAFYQITTIMDLQTGAPQQAAVAATAVAYVVIPYCAARAIEQLLGR